MKRTISRRVTGTASAMIILLLLFGGIAYMQTESNASQIDNRNLRELSRIGQGIEGRLNNLQSVLKSLAGDKDFIVDTIIVSTHDHYVDALRNNGSTDSAEIINKIDSLKNDILDRKNVILKSKAALIPNLTANIPQKLPDESVKNIREGQSVFKINLAEQALHLWYNGKNDSIGDTLHAVFDFGALRPTLTSVYMETVFLADVTGSVFLWESDRAGIRIHELAAMDTLLKKSGSGISGIGVSNIVKATIAGQDYRFYLLPIRVNLRELKNNNAIPDGDYTRLILGGMVPVSEYMQQSFSIDPTMALWLGFLVIAGILVVPFVRIFTMGARERLRIGHLLYLVIALIYGTGFAGFYLADIAHYSKLKKDMGTQLSATADTIVDNLEFEIQKAINELQYHTSALNDSIINIHDFLNLENRELETLRFKNKILPATQSLGKPGCEPDSLRLKEGISPDSTDFYPFYQMVFWADNTGMQIAKWTPRSQNTPRINIGDRGYFRAIKNDRAWKHISNVEPDTAKCKTRDGTDSEITPYYIESVRSWTTGENLAIISIPWRFNDNRNNKNDADLAENADNNSENNIDVAENSGNSSGTNVDNNAGEAVNTDIEHTGVSVITTELVSISNPVLPAGVNLAVVDDNTRTLFHTRTERILDENFAEETGNDKLLRSVIAARADKDNLELTYGGRRKLMSVRPLPGRPLYLIVFKDISLIDTVRFEAWFEGGALFTIWVVLILVMLYLLNRISASRMAWIWPDLVRPGKYVLLILIAVVYIVVFLIHANIQGHPHIHPATLLVPVMFLGLSLIVLSWGRWPNPRGRESHLGWLVFFSAIFFIVVLSVLYKTVPWLELFATILCLLIVVLWLRISNLRNSLDRWAGDFSSRMIYTTAMVCGLMVIGLLPGYLTYKYTYQDHSEHLVKYHQLELANALTERRYRIDEFMRTNWATQYPRKADVSSIEKCARDYDMAFNKLIFGTTVQYGNTVPKNDNGHSDHEQFAGIHEAIHGIFGDHIPFLTDASVRMRQLSSDPVDRCWDYSENNDTLQLQIGDRRILSTIPTAAGWVNTPGILLIGAVLMGLFLIIYRVSRWVFFSHLEHPDPLTLNDVLPKPGDDWKPMILVGNRSISRVPIHLRREELHYIDMILHDKGQTDMPELPTESIPEEAKSIVIDYADHRFEETNWNRGMLQFLEKYVFSGDPRPLILITSRDLKDLLPAAQTNGSEHGQIKNRWDRVLGRFTKVILSDDLPPVLFEISMQLRLIRHLCNDLNDMTGVITGGLSESKGDPGKIREYRDVAHEAAVKMAWLNEEVDGLYRLLNPKESEGIRQPSSVYPDVLLNKKVNESTELLYLLSVRIKNRTALPEGDRQIIDMLDELAGNSEKLKVKLENIVAGIADEARPPAEEYGYLSSLTKRTRQLVYQPLKVVRMWIFPSARMKAERKVFRQKKNIRELLQTLLIECGRHERLQDIGRHILARPDCFSLKESEVIDLVNESAEAYYAARWAILSKPERLIASQLAKGAIVNPKSPKALSRLYARGLITRWPELRLDNESFAHYINDTVSADQLFTWEREGIPSTWELIRGPFVIALIVIALFLFWSHRDFLGTTIAFLGTLGVGLGAILNLLSKLNRGNGGGEMKNTDVK